MQAILEQHTFKCNEFNEFCPRKLSRELVNNCCSIFDRLASRICCILYSRCFNGLILISLLHYPYSILFSIIFQTHNYYSVPCIHVELLMGPGQCCMIIKNPLSLAIGM